MADPYRTAALRAGRRPNLYVPEENQEWQEGQKLIGPEAAWRRNYEFVLQQTGDPQRAEAAANSIARTERRQELTQLATSVAGPVMRGGELATGLARTVMGGSRAAEAPGAMRALPPPRRNAMYPDEMLAPEVIPMGGPSPNAPRLTYAKPETRYRMAVDRPAQGRPLSNYETPEINEMFVRPEDARSFSSGSVRGTVDPLDVLAAEGGPSSEAVELAQRIARQRAEGRAATVANEEARFAGGEGPNYAEEVLNQRRLAAEQRARAAEQEARFQSGQIDAMANEGGGAGRQATINDLNRAAEADFRARQMGTLDDEAGAITSGRNPPQQVARALQVVERPRTIRGANNQTMSAPEFIGPPEVQGPRQVTPGSFIGPAERQGPPELIGPRQAPVQMPAPFAEPNAITSQRSSLESLIAAEENRRLAMQRTQAQRDALATAIGDASMARTYGPGQGSLLAPSKGGNTGALVLGGSLLPAAAIITGSQQAQPPGQPAGSASTGATVPGAGTDISDFSRLDYVAPAATDVARFSQMDFVPPAAKAAVQQARSQAAPLPPTRPAELAREQPGIFSKIFGQPATTRQLFEQSQADPSDSGAWMRAERQYARTHKDDPNFDVTKLNEQGMKRGGAAGKPDSVHKALEIIHHLLTRSH